MKAGRFTWIILFFISGVSHADTLQETFQSITYKDSAHTTAIWNQELHKIHPPLAISLTDGLNNEDSLDADVGDGSDGAFTPSTYANFSVGGSINSQTITIDTDAHPVLQFTSFNLEAGWQIQGRGSRPLWIKVLGAVIINGVVDCSGSDGQPISTNTTVVSAGGGGRCGGGNGGAGGSSLTLAEDGDSGGTNSSGGVAGVSAATGSGGGGGGGYSGFTGSPGFIAASANGGAVGASFTDPTFNIFGASGTGGGSGGGGGGYSTSGLTGGGGGAGGGVIRITSVGDITLGTGGALLARAGSGGGGVSGAGGGGGAGGGIWLQTPGIVTNNGTIDASQTVSNQNGGAATNKGGFGTNGRTWLTSSQSVINGNIESPESDRFGTGPCFCAGEIHYSTAAYEAETLSYDLRNTAPIPQLLSGTTVLPDASTFSIFAAGSDDQFLSDDTGFVNSSSLETLKGKRYVRFKVQMQLQTSSFASTAAQVSQLNLGYTGDMQNQFNFSGGCGTLSGPGEFFGLIAVFLFLYLITSGRLRRKDPLLHTPS